MTGTSDASQFPGLTGDALAAVRHRGSHLQIVAGAGSGKTEVVAQRVVDLLADGSPAESIVAFTFTERAAAELKARIARRVEDRLGREALARLTSLFVGTIHAYCFRLLQQRVPRYETYDVLDDNRLTAFLAREGKQLLQGRGANYPDPVSEANPAACWGLLMRPTRIEPATFGLKGLRCRRFAQLALSPESQHRCEMR